MVVFRQLLPSQRSFPQYCVFSFSHHIQQRISFSILHHLFSKKKIKIIILHFKVVFLFYFIPIIIEVSKHNHIKILNLDDPKHTTLQTTNKQQSKKQNLKI